ncbi:MAG TPA: TIGR03086 family metal-binding protein [Candidatus Saccharimonadales bacterium]|nr:TIGR03086 family metal-binding protein [Candidatus Saccharimonadales bacterium]
MDAKQLFQEATTLADGCTRRVRPEHMGLPTPCSEWDLTKLLNHMVYELSWVPDMLAGKTVTDVGTKYDGDLLQSDPLAAWQRALAAAQAAVQQTDEDSVVHLSYADVPAKHYIRELGGDMLIHGWDVGQALQSSLVMRPELAQAVYDGVLPRADEFRQSGLFGTPLPAEQADNTQVKLLAFFGRSQDTWLARLHTNVL